MKPDPLETEADIMIKKVGKKYAVVSEHTGRKFGTYGTKAEAERRLRQVEFFKHAKAGKAKAAASRGSAKK